MQKSNERVTRDHLQKIAYVYIRQSKPEQVENCLESKKRQYALADLAAEYGFEKIKINDRDQGISGSEVSAS